jgi:very-short-patch-repair endonuclease
VSSGRIDGVMARVAAERAGPFTRADARAAAATLAQVRHRIASGVWREPYPGVYVHAATALTDGVQLRAALLFAGPNAAASHRCAAKMWKFDKIEAPAVEITVPPDEHPRAPNLHVHRSATVTTADITHRHDVRITKPVRTVIDLAGVVDASTLEVAFESARRQRLVTVNAVRARFEAVAGRGRRGAATLRRLLDELDGTAPAESVLEVKTAQLLRSSALAPPVRQHEVRAFGRRYRLDFAWPAQRVALETDGFMSHGDVGDFQRDRTRWSDLAAAGWHIIIVTWDDVVRRPHYVLARVAAALAR